ncbi:hypothetical protein [Nibribacter koreensis]|uniref:VanZ family protein n=1 Tax=Nibribacter koreensis TaxID=1084519 RepID=UPI0031E5AB24
MRTRYYAPALGWAVVILIGTLLPANALPPAPEWDFLTFDSLVHAIIFGTQLFLLLWALHKDPSVTLSSLTIFLAFLAVVSFGVGTEFLQGAMPFGRVTSPVDAISNAVGGVFGLAFWGLSRRF